MAAVSKDRVVTSWFETALTLRLLTMTAMNEELPMTLAYPIASNAAHPARLSPGYRSTIKRSPQKPLIPCATRCRN